MSEWTDSLPKVKVTSNGRPESTEVYINGVPWGRWVKAVTVEYTDDTVPMVTLSFYAALEGDQQEVDIAV